jgi:class 3 adenylate cyclase
VVKTIGDAVMAVFQKPENALQASIDIQRNIHTFNENYPQEDAVTIKIGIHYGPAIVVNSNNSLDYFGRTVNIAARIQGESHGGDIVLSCEGLDRPELRAMVEVLEGGVEYFTADLKGIENAMHLVRITKGRVLSTPQDLANEESFALQN